MSTRAPLQNNSDFDRASKDSSLRSRHVIVLKDGARLGLLVWGVFLSLDRKTMFSMLPPAGRVPPRSRRRRATVKPRSREGATTGASLHLHLVHPHPHPHLLLPPFSLRPFLQTNPSHLPGRFSSSPEQVTTGLIWGLCGPQDSENHPCSLLGAVIVRQP